MQYEQNELGAFASFRQKPTTPSLPSYTMPHILVVDDDPLFRALLQRAALAKAIEITACSSWREIGTLAHPQQFDAAIVDYYLDGLKESLTGTDIARALEGTPVLLVSNSDHCISNGEAWPEGVRKFMNKRHGVERILKNVATIVRP